MWRPAGPFLASPVVHASVVSGRAGSHIGANMPVEVVTQPTEEPVSLEDAKEHLRVEVSAEDKLISRLITDARQWAENYTRRAFVPQTWRLWARQFPSSGFNQDGEARIVPPNREFLAEAIQLPGGRVASISSVSFVASDGTQQTLSAADYQLESRDPWKPSMVLPAYGTSWPSTRDQPSAVQIQYVVGYASTAAVPSVIRQAILLHVGWSYANREPKTFGTTGADAQMMAALQMKLADYRLFEFA